MINSTVFGVTSQNLPILSFGFGHKGAPVLILGGVHGNEPEGVVAALGLIQHWRELYSHNLQITVVPTFNLDGVLKQQRKNARGVDLNRNLPTKDWTAQVAEEKYHPGPEANSEPENKALVQWIETHKPKFIISLHSWKPCLNVNGNCKLEAEAIHRLTKYPVVEDIGYPTPGCLGSYTGLERDIPTITYEIERGLDPQSTLSLHVPAVIEALKVFEKRQ